MSKITFNNQNNQFFLHLKSSVDQYFKEKNLKHTGDYRLYLKSLILIGSAVSIYILLLFTSMPWLLAVLLVSTLGVLMACIGFGVMHDANHGSYSTNKHVNDFIGLIASNGLGANAYFWKQKHNIIHHTYTNVDGIDDDIAKSPIIRQCESQRWVPLHQIQHIYLFPVYAMTSLFWIFIMDFSKYFTRKINGTPAWKMTFVNHLVFWLTKIYYVSVFIAFPIFKLGFSSWLVGYLLMNAMMGLALSVVFQLAHVVENTEFEHVALDENKHIESAWAEHQVKTTSNFAMDNKIVSWFVGGLNFQIEHHLFPKISHVHYPAISKIVQQSCKEFGLPYNHFDTTRAAIFSHLRTMKQLGKKPLLITQAA